MPKGVDDDQRCGRAPMRLPADAQLESVRARVDQQAARVAELGQWPAWISAESLTFRVPVPEGGLAPGFDAGLACALDLIPRDRQRLAARLHAAYTPGAVAQARAEAETMDPDSDTCWWLAACSVCREGEIDEEAFSAQLDAFAVLADDPDARRTAAFDELAEMRGRYRLVDDIPFGTEDGCQQGAYLDGHRWAVMYASHHDLYFVGTYEPTLSLEDFRFSDELDDQGRQRSGPVHGSHQFVKAGSRDELDRIVAVVRGKLE